MKCARNCEKVLMLTATPYFNSVCDFIPLINFLHKKEIVRPWAQSLERKKGNIWKAKTVKYFIRGCKLSSKKITKSRVEKQLNVVEKLIQGRVAFAQKVTGKGTNYPEVVIERVVIPMSAKYEAAFMKALEDIDLFSAPEKFANGYRRAVNALGADKYISGKLKKVIEIIQADKSKYARNIIYSSWIKFGTNILESALESRNITFEKITGETPAVERVEIVKKYNAGKINTLIISSAGSTGIDLMGVQNIIVLDPVWNPATLEQIIGRGVRNKSHITLPEEKRVVKVYLLLYAEKDVISGKQKTSKSGDFILYSVIENKMNILKPVIAMIRRASIF
jgi:SNF2 family DNA or RNA helicase